MDEFDKQKFLEIVKNIFAKKKRNQRDQQLIRQFFKTSKQSEFWKKITKNSDKLLDLLSEQFILVEHEQDTPIQLKGHKQEKCVILLIQGFIEVKYEANNRLYSSQEKISVFNESKFTDFENSLNDSIISNERSPFKPRGSKRKQTTSPQRNLKSEKLEAVIQMKELLKEKGEEFKHFSCSDLDLVGVNMTYNNRKRVSEKTFLTNIKTRKQKIINEDDEFSFQLQKKPDSFHVQEIDKQQPPYIYLSTRFEPGDVMNKYLFNEREVDYDDLTYVALTNISFLTLEVQQIVSFLEHRNEYLQKYDQFLDELFSAQNFLQQLNPFDVQLIKDIYYVEENIKQGDNVVLQNQKENSVSFYLIKEGFFDLLLEQKKNKYVSIQNQYNFVGNEINQKQIITIQNKKNNLQYNTVAMFQKGQIFGEEIIFNQQKIYKYTVRKKTPYSELLAFKFTKVEHIPQPLYQFIFQQYEKKQQIQIASDGEEDYEIQDQITAKYNNFFGNNHQNRFNHPYFDQNVSLFQIDMNPQYQQKYTDQLFPFNTQNKNQNSLKKIVLNELVNQSLCKPDNFHNIFQDRSQLLTNIGGRDRSQSGGENQRIQQNLIEQKDFELYTPNTVIPIICRKNQFVKKAIKIEGTFSHRPNSAENQNIHNLRYQQYQFPPIHALYKQINNETQYNTEVQKEIQPKNDETNQQISSPKQTPNDKVKTIKIQFDFQQEEQKDLDEKGYSSSILYEKQHSLLPISTRKIQSSNSTRKFKGELVTGRSLNRFNQIIQSTSYSNIKPENSDSKKDIHQNELQFNDDQSIHQNHLQLSNFNESTNQSPQNSQRVVTDGLKGSKIRKTSPQDKGKREENQKKSTLIKLLFQIEHDKWIKLEQSKNQALNLLQRNFSPSQKERLKIDKQASEDEIFLPKSNNSQKNIMRNNFIREDQSPKSKPQNIFLNNNNNSKIQRSLSASKFQNQQIQSKALTQQRFQNSSNNSNSPIRIKANTPINFNSHQKQLSKQNFINNKASNERKNLVKNQSQLGKNGSQNKTNQKLSTTQEDKIGQQNNFELKLRQKQKSLDRKQSREKSHQQQRQRKNISQDQDKCQNNLSQKKVQDIQQKGNQSKQNLKDNCIKKIQKEENRDEKVESIQKVLKKRDLDLQRNISNKNNISHEKINNKQKNNHNKSLNSEQYFQENNEEIQSQKKIKQKLKNQSSKRDLSSEKNNEEKQLSMKKQQNQQIDNTQKSKIQPITENIIKPKKKISEKDEQYPHIQDFDLNNKINSQSKNESTAKKQLRIKNSDNYEEINKNVDQKVHKAKNNSRSVSSDKNLQEKKSPRIRNNESLDKNNGKKEIKQNSDKINIEGKQQKQINNKIIQENTEALDKKQLREKNSIKQQQKVQQENKDKVIDNPKSKEKKVNKTEYNSDEEAQKQKRKDQKIKDISLQNKNDIKVDSQQTSKKEKIQQTQNSPNKIVKKEEKIQEIKKIYQQNYKQNEVITQNKTQNETIVKKENKSPDKNLKKKKQTEQNVDQNKLIKIEDQQNKQALQNVKSTQKQAGIEKQDKEITPNKYPDKQNPKEIREKNNKKDKLQVDQNDNDINSQERQKTNKSNSALKTIINQIDIQNNQVQQQDEKIQQNKSEDKEKSNKQRINSNGQKKQFNDKIIKYDKQNRPLSPQQRSQKIKELNNKIQNDQQNKIEQNGKIINKLKEIVQEDSEGNESSPISKQRVSKIYLNEQAKNSLQEKQNKQHEFNVKKVARNNNFLSSN